MSPSTYPRMHAFPKTPATLRWTRRAWLAGAAAIVAPVRVRLASTRWGAARSATGYVTGWRPLTLTDGLGRAAAPLDPGPVQALAQRAVEAAQAAGASYADARLSRIVEHHYMGLRLEFEFVGFGVRALANGCWGFASAPVWLSEPQRQDLVVQLARDAVAQAKTTARAVRRRRPVALSPVSAVTGTWQTPCPIDPFSISPEEKHEMIEYWKAVAASCNLMIQPSGSFLHFARQERVLATSGGTLVTQTGYESGGHLNLASTLRMFGAAADGRGGAIDIPFSGQGWEYILAQDIPAKIRAVATVHSLPGTPVAIGRYTLVCDGATMAAVLGETLGVATQLDRALGYEANASGTSFLNDPLAMVGTARVAAPVVTVTANRTAPTQLATVAWDDEGVVPPAFTLVKDGILHDFQTTREQAAWLAPYYQRIGRAVTSNGCAASQDALRLPLQMRPNLALAPSEKPVSLEALIASVQSGLFIEQGAMTQVDFQARNGVLRGTMHKIVQGKVGKKVAGGVVQVNVPQWWKSVQAVGDARTTGYHASTQYNDPWHGRHQPGFKGNPGQQTSYTAQGVAAVIEQQAVINPRQRV